VNADSSPSGRSQPDDRYEPLPGFVDLPGWVWRRLPTPARVGVALLPFVIVGLVLVLGPGIEKSKEERASSEEQQAARQREARVAAQREQQRPRFATAAPAPDSVAGRERLLAAAARSVRADATARAAAGEFSGPIRGVDCEPFPRTTSNRGAERDLSKTAGAYSCLAVTSRFGGSTGDGEVAPYTQSEAGTIGYPYRARIDFGSGRYAFCKVGGRPGEGNRWSDQPTVPRVCGGG
jgi:hypothetical protein